MLQLKIREVRQKLRGNQLLSTTPSTPNAFSNSGASPSVDEKHDQSPNPKQSLESDQVLSGLSDQ